MYILSLWNTILQISIFLTIPLQKNTQQKYHIYFIYPPLFLFMNVFSLSLSLESSLALWWHSTKIHPLCRFANMHVTLLHVVFPSCTSHFCMSFSHHANHSSACHVCHCIMRAWYWGSTYMHRLYMNMKHIHHFTKHTTKTLERDFYHGIFLNHTVRTICTKWNSWVFTFGDTS